MFLVITTSLLRPAVNLFDTGTELSEVSTSSTSFPVLQWGNFNSPIYYMSLKTVCDIPIHVVSKVMSLLRVGDLHTGVPLEVVGILARMSRVGTSFIDKLFK